MRRFHHTFLQYPVYSSFHIHEVHYLFYLKQILFEFASAFPLIHLQFQYILFFILIFIQRSLSLIFSQASNALSNRFPKRDMISRSAKGSVEKTSVSICIPVYTINFFYQACIIFFLWFFILDSYPNIWA